MKKHVKNLLLYLFNKFHKYNNQKTNVVIFTTPRSGSTMLLDLLNADKEVRIINEPLNLNKDRLISKFQNLKHKDRYISLEEYEKEELIIYFNDLFTSNKVYSREFYDLFTGKHTFYSKRTVVKMVRFSDQISWFQSNFNEEIIYLIRHPIPTVLSRLKNNWKDYCEDYFLNTEFREKYFTNDIERIAEEIMSKSNNFEKMVLSWCFENIAIFKAINDKIMIVGFEELIISPEEILTKISKKYEFNLNQRLIHLDKPSISSKYSSEENISLIRDNNKSKLAYKWVDSVDIVQIKRVYEIMHAFTIDIFDEKTHKIKDKYCN